MDIEISFGDEAVKTTSEELTRIAAGMKKQYHYHWIKDAPWTIDSDEYRKRCDKKQCAPKKSANKYKSDSVC